MSNQIFNSTCLPQSTSVFASLSKSDLETPACLSTKVLHSLIASGVPRHFAERWWPYVICNGLAFKKDNGFHLHDPDIPSPSTQLSRQQWDDVQAWAARHFSSEQTCKESELGRLYLPLFSSSNSDTLTLEELERVFEACTLTESFAAHRIAHLVFNTLDRSSASGGPTEAGAEAEAEHRLSLESLADWFSRVCPRAFADLHARCQALFQFGANLATEFPEFNLHDVDQLPKRNESVLTPAWGWLLASVLPSTFLSESRSLISALRRWRLLYSARLHSLKMSEVQERIGHFGSSTGVALIQYELEPGCRGLVCLALDAPLQSSTDRIGGPNTVLFHIYPKCLIHYLRSSSVTFNFVSKKIMRGIVAWAPESSETPLLELDYARKTLTLEGVLLKFLELELWACDPIAASEDEQKTVLKKGDRRPIGRWTEDCPPSENRQSTSAIKRGAGEGAQAKGSTAPPKKIRRRSDPQALLNALSKQQQSNENRSRDASVSGADAHDPHLEVILVDPEVEEDDKSSARDSGTHEQDEDDDSQDLPLVRVATLFSSPGATHHH